MKRVVIVGGGSGSLLAKKLDSKFQVTLIEKKKAYFHQIGSVRAVVDGDWAEKVYIPYDKLLKKGKIVNDEVIEVSSTQVRLKNHEPVTFDYLVLATGSEFNFPVKSISNEPSESIAKHKEMAAAVKSASKILIVGGGPVGIEIAAEIGAKYPEKKITLVHSAAELLTPQFSKELKTKITAQLTKFHVDIVLSEKVVFTEADNGLILNEAKTYTTESGKTFEADLCLRCIGGRPNTTIYQTNFADQISESGRLKVNEFLQLNGQQNIFVMGDLADTNEVKTSYAAGNQVPVIAQNIESLASNKPNKMKKHTPIKPALFISLGPANGIGQLGTMMFGNFLVKNLKSKNLMVPRVWGELNQKMPKK